MPDLKTPKWIYWIVTTVALLLGLIGVVMPLMPTTPFLIVALWAAGKCSPKLAHWLESHPKIGPVLKDWRDHRAIPIKAKILACTMMFVSYTFMWYRGTSTMVLWIVAASLGMVMAYILTKPSR